MAEGGLRPPAPFSFTTSTTPSESSRSWDQWLEQFDFYMTATEKASKPGEVQVATLLTLLGQQGLELFRTFNLDADDKKNIATVKDKFSNHFKPRVREEYERFKFYGRIQKPGESFDQYLTVLRDLITTCNFHEAERDKALRDRIVFGISSSEVREELFNSQTSITLQQAIEVCQRHETTKQYMQGMEPTVTEKTHVVTNQPSKPKGYKSTNTATCNRCGGHHKPKCCPAYDKLCKKCGAKGHFAKMCFTKKSTNIPSTKPYTKHSAHEIYEPSPDTTTTPGYKHLAYNTTSTTSSTDKEWYVTYKVHDQPLKLKVDTGATCNVMPYSVYKSLNSSDKHLSKFRSDLFSFSGHKLNVLGKATLTVETSDQMSAIDFVIVDNSESATLLGLESCKHFGLVNVAHTISDPIALQYKDIFEGLGTLPSRYALRLKDDAKPVIQSARRVPFRLRNKLKETLDLMEKQGAITKVKIATDWVHPIVNVLKPNNTLRICLDPTELNKNIKREHYALPTPVEIFSKLTKSSIFTTLDATSGFMQLELDEQSSYMTTFATTFGRYRFLRLPFGISSAPEVFHRTVSEMFSDIEGVEVYIDDILIHAKNKTEHDRTLTRVFQRCRDKNFRLNLSKCKFAQTELKFLGHIIGHNEVKADPAKIEAIVNMPKPENPADVSRILGMATYLAKFCPNLSEVTAPLRELTKKGITWIWTDEHDESWKNLKALVANSPSLCMFDPQKQLVLSVDASQNGLGAVLMHDGQPIEFASCSLTSTQKAYAQIEKEFLAVQFGLQRFHQYIYGQHVTIETDHLPLLGIMKKPLNELTPRLLRMRLRNQLYDYKLVHKPGKELVLADTLSRAFLNETACHTSDNSARDTEQVSAIVQDIVVNQSLKEKLIRHSSNDTGMHTLQSYIMNGWPTSRRSCVDTLKPYWNVRYDLSTHQGLILKSNQIVIPPSMRPEILKTIHIGHMGVSKCIERAKNTVYWPSYIQQLTDLVESCSQCQEHAKANATPVLQPFDIPEYPMQHVSMDIFYLNGYEYLVTVDRYSKWPTCNLLNSSTTKEIVKHLTDFFNNFGYPESITSDNGPQFTSFEFKTFTQVNNIEHVTTSPYLSRANGLAERMNQTIKVNLTKALESGQNLTDVLNTLRTTPIGNGLPSPAVLLQGRELRLKHGLHCLPEQLKPKVVDHSKIKDLLHKRSNESVFNSNSSTSRPRFHLGMNVFVKTGHRKWVRGTIVQHAGTPYSFIVELQNGKKVRRSQHHLRLVRGTNSYKPPINVTTAPSTDQTNSSIAITTPHVTTSANVPTGTSSTSQYITRSGRVSRPPQRLVQQ